MMRVHNRDVRRATRILLTQVGIAVLAAAIGLIYARPVGLSAMIGGGTAVVANTLFATGIFGPYQAQRPGKLVARFYGAELLKLLFIVSAFAAAFAWVKPLSVWALIGAFLMVQVLPLLLVNRLAS